MPLLNRFSRLFAADLHAVLDSIEEPDILLRQAVRDMESELANMQTQVRAAEEQSERTQSLKVAELESLASLDEELDICFVAGEEALARGLVRRKLEAQKRAQTFGRQHASAEKSRIELESALESNRARLNAMREKLDVLVENPNPAGRSSTCEVSVDGEEIDIAFLREKQRRVRS